MDNRLGDLTITARHGWSPLQRVLVMAAIVGALELALWNLGWCLWILNLVLLGGFGLIVVFKVLSVVVGLLVHDIESADPVREAPPNWPLYSILVPLYREATILHELLAALERLDYPRDRLDVKWLLEADDAETLDAVRQIHLPSWVELVIVPPGEPRTKPRACNVGLAQARGDFVVVFDAEDRPEPDQLKKAVIIFRRHPPSVSCLQARLNYYNPDDNILTRWFTLEYTTWFDLYLPGLHTLKAPIPLGGTSNHFRTRELQRVGGWDPWNVTEDCDLGLRLAREGLETRIMDSTTWEEAVSRLGPWIRQRSRWTKGYWQTLLAHTRKPSDAFRRLGVWKLFQMLLIVGGQVFSLLMTPVCWVVLAAWAVIQWPIFYPESPFTEVFFVVFVFMLLCNLLFVIMHILGAWQRRQYWLIKDALLLPAYWILMGIGAWRGLFQHIVAPFKWEKTPHGAAAQPSHVPVPGAAPRRALENTPVSAGVRWLTSLVLLGLFSGVVWCSLSMPSWLGHDERIRVARLRLDGIGTIAESPLDTAWTHGRRLTLDVEVDPRVAPQADSAPRLFKALVFLKVLDWEWYQAVTSDCEVRGRTVRVHIPLTADAGWTPVLHKRPWGLWCLRRVHSVGVRLVNDGPPVEVVRILNTRLETGLTPDLAIAVVKAPEQSEQHRMEEIRFTLSREYANPFDPAQIDVTASIRSPAGRTLSVAAFYAQDYLRDRLPDGKERLVAHNEPYWAFRYTPSHPGLYTWSLEGVDRSGARAATPPRTWQVTAAPGRGFVRVDPQDPRFFAYENGDFLYPIALNVRSPSDTLQPPDRDYPVPAPEEGTYAMESYLQRMSASRMNLARVWMAPWFGGIEWNRNEPGYHGLGQYNLQNAWRIDYLLARAAEHDLLIELVLQSHGPFTRRYDSQWADNPYNRTQGGPLREPQELFTDRDSEAQRLFRNRLRYVAARYGANPRVFGWTMWIEVDAVIPSFYGTYQRDWHARTIPFFRRYDVGNHPISTEYQTSFGNPQVWSMPEIDYVQLAAYEFPSAGSATLTRLREASAFMDQYRKPRLAEEYGGGFEWTRMKPIATDIHDGLWGGWMLPLSATPMAWWWHLVFAKDLDRFYTGFSRYIEGEDLRGIDYRFDSLPLENGRGLQALVRRADDHAYAWIRREADYPQRRGNQMIAISAGEGTTVRDFNPLSDKAPLRFDAVEGALLPLRQMTNGVYEVSLWETWGDPAVTRWTVTNTLTDLAIALPVLQRDVALKVRRIGSAAP